ncbi:MAG TPA: response regulator transcription factor [Actinomycetota bacterium]|jgi:DNA-binding CsgD family transcriptional regulator|nr:response regulator transcription factor [Actinomycetota bacterium]
MRFQSALGHYVLRPEGREAPKDGGPEHTQGKLVLVLTTRRLVGDAFVGSLRLVGFTARLTSSAAELDAELTRLPFLHRAAVVVDVKDLDELSRSNMTGRGRLKTPPVVGYVEVPASMGRDSAVRLGMCALVYSDTPLEQFAGLLMSLTEGSAPRRVKVLRGSSRSESAPRPSGVSSTLTTREKEVLSLLALGLGPREIARRLAMSPNTARTHVQRILTKLQVHSSLEAVAVAVRRGLIPGQRPDREPLIS